MKGRSDAGGEGPGLITEVGGEPVGRRPGWSRWWLVGAVLLAAGGLLLFGLFGEQDPAPRVEPPTFPSSTTTPGSSGEAPLAVAWDLAERAGIRCDQDDGRDLTLEVCEYRGDWVSIRVFPAGDRDAVLEWAVSMVDRFGSDVLVGDGWGIEYLFSSGSERRLEEIRAALGEGEIVASRRARVVAVEVPEVKMGGPPLVWQRVMDLEEDQAFTSVLAAESGLWAVAGDDQEPSVLWYSADGLVWRGLDTAALLGDGAVVSMLVQGGPGLVAVGLRPAGSTREAVAWTSTDGRDWAVSPLGYTIPEPERSFEVTGLDFEQVAARPLGAIIAASVWERIDFDHEELERNIRAALPDGLGEYEIDFWSWGVSVSVGPFRVFSEAFRNLDIDQDLFDLYEQSMMSEHSDPILFVTDNYESWRQVDEWPVGDEDAQVGAMIATPDGFLAFAGRWGWGWEPDGLYSSTDGITWQETESPADPGFIPWFGTHRGRLLMLGEGWPPVLWESIDGGTTWTAGGSLPADAWEVQAGGLGLVAWGVHESESWYATSGEPTVVESGGYTMTVGEEHLSISDTHRDTELTADLTNAGWDSMPEFIVADHERQMLTVVDPDSGETLLTITYREMEDAFEDAEERTEVDPASFVAYSADGKVWSEQAILEIAGVTAWPDLVAVGDDFAVMVVGDFDNGTSLWRGTGSGRAIDGTFEVETEFYLIPGFDDTDGVLERVELMEEWMAAGQPCEFLTNFSDISVGTPVIVADSKGNIVGKSFLNGGRIAKRYGPCLFDFTIEGVPQSDFYRIRIGARQWYVVSYDELVSSDWTVALVLESN